MFGKRSTGDDSSQKVVLRPQTGPAVQPGQPQAAHPAPNPAALVEGGRAPIPSAGHRTSEMFLQIAQRLTGRGETKKPRGSLLSPLIDRLRKK